MMNKKSTPFIMKRAKPWWQRKYIVVVVLRKPRSNKLLDVIHAPKNTIFCASRELGFELFVVKKMYMINSVSKKDQTKSSKKRENE